jgi:hypothetical protein
MDRRAKSLNAVIIANRKGLKNQLKSFWGRSTGQIVKPEGDGGYARYVFFYLFTYAQLDTDVVFCLFTGIRSSRR